LGDKAPISKILCVFVACISNPGVITGLERQNNIIACRIWSIHSCSICIENQVWEEKSDRICYGLRIQQIQISGLKYIAKPLVTRGSGRINMQEKEIHFNSGDIELAGTIALPDTGGPFPGVLLVTGSGPVDRNENAKKLTINTFYEFSRFLAENGIATLRYDKRGVGQSTGDFFETGFFDNVEDALAAVKYMKQQHDFQPDYIFVLGHSEGALIATRLAGTGAEVTGIILLAGSAHTGEDILKWQAIEIAKGMKGFNAWLIKTLHIDIAKSQQKQIDKIKRSKENWYRVQLVQKLNAKWFREFMAYNPSEDMPHVQVPVLAITGSKDIQVDPADLEIMAQLVKAPFEDHLIQDMTHLLRVEKGEASISKYKEEVMRPVEPQLMDIVLKWLKEQADMQNEPHVETSVLE
jgi:alpha/beta superfamily hydrolase